MVYTGHKSGKTFEIREVSSGKKLKDPVIDKVVKNLMESRNKFVKSLVESCLRVVSDFDPMNQIELSEQLAVRVILGKIRHDRAKYLAKGKTIPGWSGSLEYQTRAATALLLLLEPPYVLDDDKRAGRPQAAKARRKHRPRR